MLVQSKSLNAFEARLMRIEKTSKHGTMYLAGEGEVKSTQMSASQLRAKIKPSGTPISGAGILAAPKWMMAFVLGCLAMLAGRLLGYHVIGDVTAQYAQGDQMMALILRHAGEIGVGFAALVAAATFWGARGAGTKMAMVAGFALMLIGEADVAKQMPEAWEVMFSAQYAANALQPTAGALNNIQMITSLLQGVNI